LPACIVATISANASSASRPICLSYARQSYRG
jgi:hypothetical protein